MNAALATVAASGLAVVAGACASAGTPPLDVPPLRAPTAAEDVARWSGDLLSGDAAASRAAEEVLLEPDDAHRAAIATQAARVPAERDPRWLLVLDRHGLLPALSDADRADLALRETRHRSPAVVLRGQDALLRLAREKPEVLVERLSGPGPGREALAVVLGGVGYADAVPALCVLFAESPAVEERRGAAQALGRLVPGAPPLRPEDEAGERAKAAQAVRTTWKDSPRAQPAGR